MRRLAVIGAVLIGLAACGDGDGGSAPALGDAGIRAATVVAQTDASQQPVDAVPSPDGRLIYYLATGDSSASAALFRVNADGGPVSTVLSGAPLVKPTGLAISTDGSRVFAADPEVGIVTTPVGNASPVVLAGTEARQPRGMDVVSTPGGDVVYFTGVDPGGSATGLFRIPASGGPVIAVAQGPPFVSPDAVVVAHDGVAYLSDRGSEPGRGTVFRVRGTNVDPVLSDLHLGSPGGVTLVHDDATLLVSSLDGHSHADQVLFLDLASGRTAAATKVIGANRNSSGGLHRAYAAAVLAWADILRPGRIYRVDPF
jgi:sugar lactone lactonase YvrE